MRGADTFTESLFTMRRLEDSCLQISRADATRKQGKFDEADAVAVSCWKLANLGEATGPTVARRALLLKGLDILIAQRDATQLPASNAGWIKAFEDALHKLK